MTRQLTTFYKMANVKPPRPSAARAQINLQQFLRELHDDTDSESVNFECGGLYDFQFKRISGVVTSS